MWAPPYWSYKPVEAWSRFATSERPQWNSSAQHPGELKSEKHGLSKSCPCHGKYDMLIYTCFEIDIQLINTVRKCAKEISIFTCTFHIYFPWLHPLLRQHQFERIPSENMSKVKQLLRTVTVRNWNHHWRKLSKGILSLAVLVHSAAIKISLNAWVL